MSDKEENKGGGFFGKLKSLVVEETPDGPKKPDPSAATVAVAPVVPASTSIFARGTSAPAPTTGVVDDPQIRRVLDDTVAKFPALTAFRENYKGLQTVIPDEWTRTRAAIATTISRGFDSNVILSQADECLRALDAAEQKDNAAVTRALQDRVGKLEAEVATKLQQAEQLRLEAKRLEGEVAAQRSAIATERAGIDTMHQNFVATVTAYRQEFTGIKTRVSQQQTSLQGKGV